MEHSIVLTRDTPAGPLTLRPLRPEDAPALRALVDEASWAGMSNPLPPTDALMAEHLSGLIRSPGILAFAVEREGEFLGRTTLYDVVPGVRAEIGNTIYARQVWGTDVNPAAKMMLFAYAFEALGVKRVALRCDSRNTRSHGAIRRLGAVYEGTLRNYRPAADGSTASVDYFSVLPGEWPQVRAGLEQRL